MKKSVLILLALLISVQAISAISITLSKQVYYPGEILQAEITGNFITLKNQDIQIYKQGIPRQMPVISDLTKQNNIYNFYAVLPTQESDYTLEINTEYIEEGKIKTDAIKQDFKISKKQPSETNKSETKPIENRLSINPGFILTNSGEFEIKIKALDSNQEITAELEETNETRTLSLIKGIEKKLIFQSPVQNTFLKISNYYIPVFIIQKGEPVIDNQNIILTPSEIQAVLSPDNTYTFNLILTNNAEINLTNIQLSQETEPETEITINPSAISLLELWQSVQINVSVKIPKGAEENITGNLIIQSDISEEQIPISLTITKNPEEENLQGTSISETLSCSDLKGNLCKTNQDCAGEIKPSLEGSCCIGECLEVKDSNFQLILGIILMIIVIAIIIFLAWRFRRKSRQQLKSTSEILREKSSRQRERMNPSSEEVSGKLDNI